MTDDLTITRDGPIGEIHIDRRDSLNALTSEVNTGIYDALAAFERDDVRVVLVSSAGDRAFIAGADLKEIHGMSTREFVAYQKNGRRTNDAIESYPGIVIAVVDGIAYGGGFEVALAADLVVAAERAEFAVPEVKLGLVPGGGATQRLPRLVGANKAKEMLTTGEPIDAAEAKTHGLVTRSTAGDPREEAVSLAEDICENAPLAVREAKRLVDQGLDSSLETGLSFEQEVTFTLYETEDTAEGIDTFVEKRDPEFTGE
jgi:enoyl-CoA hydratase